MNFYRLVVGVILFLAQAACSSTQTTASWSNIESKHQTIQKVAVLGIMDRMSTRQNFEDELVQRLHKEGINAIAAHTMIPPARKQPKVDQVVRKLYAKGVDKVMVISLSDVQRSRSFVPGQTFVQPRTYYNRFGDYFVHTYRRVHTPGYMYRSTTIFLESTIYDLNNQQLVWKSESKSTDPYSLESVSRSYAKSIVKAMERDEII